MGQGGVNIIPRNRGDKMFRGVTQLNLDAKGRLAIPAKYRSDLLSLCEGHLIVTVDTSKSLLIYPQPTWEPIESKLSSLSSFNPKIRKLQRLLIGNASNVDMDSAGRILLPPSLRDISGLGKDVVLVGQVTKFELWNKSEWDAQFDDISDLLSDEMTPELEGFSL